MSRSCPWLQCSRGHLSRCGSFSRWPSGQCQAVLATVGFNPAPGSCPGHRCQDWLFPSGSGTGGRRWVSQAHMITPAPTATTIRSDRCTPWPLLKARRTGPSHGWEITTTHVTATATQTVVHQTAARVTGQLDQRRESCPNVPPAPSGPAERHNAAIPVNPSRLTGACPWVIGPVCGTAYGRKGHRSARASAIQAVATRRKPMPS